MRVLMIGWELPPQTSGGLGFAVAGLASALARLGVDLTMILPRQQPLNNFPFKVKFAGVKNGIYLSSYQHFHSQNTNPAKNFANQDLISQVHQFKALVEKSLAGEAYDVVHAHDWLCGPPALAAAEILQKPLVAQIHSTEFDRNGGNSVGGEIFQIEKEMVEGAKKVIAVSGYTKKIVTQNYQIPEEKVEVIHNGVDRQELGKLNDQKELALKAKGKKLIVFAGRLALQKGPDWFLKAAQIVAQHDKETIFVIAGDGDMKEQLIELAINLGIADRVVFTGFLDQEQLAVIYRNADVLIVPSVSEPFGLVALEASFFGTPLVISKNSGVLEILNHCLTVDFWDSFATAAKILAILRYRELNWALKNNAQAEVANFAWERSAQKCFSLYQEILN